MNVLHISPIYNRKSILKHGILPTFVKNDNHRLSFLENKLIDTDLKGIYTWQDCHFNEKLIKDLVYAIVWIHPRNDIASDFFNKFKYYIDWRYDHREPIYKWSQMLFDIYIAETEKEEFDYLHIQTSDDAIGETTTIKMHDKFTHENKPLCITINH